MIGIFAVLLVVGSCGDDDPGSATVTTQASPSTQAVATTQTSVTTATDTPAMPAAPTTAAPVATTSPSLPCSAEGMAQDLRDEPELYVVVDATRRAIFHTAVACDFEGLAALAQPGGFVWMGAPTPGDDPTEYFRIQEENAGVLALMLNLFSAPFGVAPIDGVNVYVWPSAAAYADWASVPEEARQGLVDLYGEGILQEAEEYLWDDGYYLGSRLEIDEAGGWRAYILAGN